MERIRKPLQGVTNIIRFNWPFYLFAMTLTISAMWLSFYVPDPYAMYLTAVAGLTFAGTVSSLLVSLYVYDLSNLYTFLWLDTLNLINPHNIVTINAGFDETSALLQQKFPAARLHVFDFYDPGLHTEASIKRARERYPAYPGTLAITTAAIPMADQTADTVFLLLAAHEIRQNDERTRFFSELRRLIKPTGQLIVVEHLRDTANFLAYTIGFLHFLSKTAWLRTFHEAKLTLQRTEHITPFITVFVLEKDDPAP